MALATIPGYPRIGKQRELKRALEGLWSGKLTEDDVVAAAAAGNRANWSAQQTAGLDLIPVNDFSLYDQVLDATALVGAVPARYEWSGDQVDLDTYFAMARGRAGDRDVVAMEMTKWFDTNYHYLVPELAPDTAFRLASEQPFTQLAAAKAAGVRAKVALIGPVSYLLLAKSTEDAFSPLRLLDRLLPTYAEVVARLAAAGAEWIQFDESMLVMDRTAVELEAVARAYTALADVKGAAKLVVHTAYDQVGASFGTLTTLPIDGIGFDFVRGPENLDLIERSGYPADKILVAGVIDGRNIWTADLGQTLDVLKRIAHRVPVDRLHVSSSSTLLHVPLDVRLETGIDPTVVPWLAFAEQKLAELAILTRGLNQGDQTIVAELAANREIIARRNASPLRRDPAVRERLASLSDSDMTRSAPFAERVAPQRDRLHLPALPTTTIGSFPQTPEVRVSRRKAERGEISAAAYDSFVEDQIRAVIAEQEALGLDVLVHGEFERNDMVQYFGEQLAGFVFTRHAWVQSYGSRYVRPPVIVGDVSRPEPMTVRWSAFAQGLTERPVKGMLTGPVTILNWSFVRDDQPRADTCRQIALAIRDEVADLDRAGIKVIQVDEPALREGVPLRKEDQAEYLQMAVESFRLATAVARPETQIHSHMCYSEFGEIIGSIEALDADVVSIENARSGLEMLEVFREHGYDKGVGPGVYDIHSPRVPPVAEIMAAVEATLDVLDRDQVWVNPDCGLKTRQQREVRAALANMVEATRAVRTKLPVAAR
ncbi:MAG: 5-methyltetrahydropteroyltriglutamate--homocysteine S-methyltransferase [Chloroflexota bacterium]|nr:5-methyltetrahydropteroyltriglutamate--homocysteine S-methyltransferase [Chloroflexota bacterium]